MGPVPKIVLVIPCFNEERRLDRAELGRLARAREDLTLLFVDDGSRDRTADVLRALSRETPRIALHALPANAGKAEAVRAGLRAAIAGGADIVGYTDADLATPVDELLRMLQVMSEGGASVLLASRVRLLGAAIERRALRHYLGRIFATVASIALRLPVYDTQCGAKLFRPTPTLEAALAQPFTSRWAFDVELLGRLAYGTRQAPPLPREAFLEVPLRAWRDVGGSKMNWKSMARAGTDLLVMAVRNRVAKQPRSR